VVQIHSPRPIILQSIIYRHANSCGVPGRAPGGRSYSYSGSQRVSWISSFTPTGYGAIAGTIAPVTIRQGTVSYGFGSVVAAVFAFARDVEEAVTAFGCQKSAATSAISFGGLLSSGKKR
jgi:hypothetical protein